jgi:hypothetical protein
VLGLAEYIRNSKVPGMSTRAEAILQEFEALPPTEQRALCRELVRRVAENPGGELYGEPLADEDIAESARVTFAMLDEEEKRAESR